MSHLELLSHARSKRTPAVQSAAVTVRLSLLAVVVAGLALGATYIAGGLDGKPEELRLLLLWALPAAVYLGARFTVGRRPVKLALASVAGVLPWIAAALALDFAPLGVGHLAGWLTFTYGDQALAASRVTTALWALPLLVLVSIRFTEGALRGALFAGLEQGVGARAAWIVSAACGALLALPVLAPGFVPIDSPYLAAGAVVAVARELVAIALFRKAGLVVAGIYRGVLAYVEGYAAGDWLSPLLPSATYVSSNDAFHALRAAGPLAAAALVVFLARRRAYVTFSPPAAT